MTDPQADPPLFRLGALLATAVFLWGVVGIAGWAAWILISGLFG